MFRFAVLLSLCVALLSPRLFAAQIGEVVTIEIGCASAKGPTPQEEAKALEELKRIILQDYIRAPGARQSLLATHAAAMLQTPDQFLVGLTTSTRIFDAKSRRLTLGASAGINTEAVNRVIDQPAAGKPAVPILFVFVARRQATVQEHDLEVTTGASSGAQASAAVRSSGSGVSGSASVGQSQTTGGSTIRRADTITYEVEPQLRATIDRSMGEVFSQRGLVIVDAAELFAASKGSLDVEALEKDFRTSSEFSTKNRVEIIRVARELGAPLMLAYGTLTLGVKRLEPGSGATLIDVMIDALVLDARGPLSTRAASLGGVRVTGAGADQTAAERTALELAARRAANDLVDQIKR